ncbi:Si-specific NAD(P)(+) transhydrogenase [Candidatus Binatia bacterium]|nr:Si-specific NAD(P)(+) transhydrogenase [Candidatus Binatia bacterium]
MESRRFDLCVVGSGPAGQKCAIQAAKLGKSVCVVERMETVGGVAINTGTIPSKALREAVVAVLASRKHADDVGSALDRTKELSLLIEYCERVIRAEIEVVRRQLLDNGIELLHGSATLLDASHVRIDGRHSSETVEAQHVLLAPGTTPARPAHVPFDGEKIVTTDELLHLPYLPQTLIVVGGGVIGTEYASMLSALGVRVTLIETRDRLLEFADREIVEALQYHLRQAGMTLRLGEKVVEIKRVPAPSASRAQGDLVEATLASGKKLHADCLLYSGGRQGATETLGLAAAGLCADERGRIKVEPGFQTCVPNVYACGDVIGFPALASASMEQGRLAACHMFGAPMVLEEEMLPYGIYAIPEISMVGATEDALTERAIPYETGIARYGETARGQLLGDETGMLKLLIHQETEAILGVHIIGTSATELVHIGQAVMRLKGTAEYFIETVFNYPTLAECYKVAAFNGRNKIRCA